MMNTLDATYLESSAAVPPNTTRTRQSERHILRALFTDTCTNVTMAAFVEALKDMPAGYFYLDEESVVNRTELKGTRDFSFKYTFRVGCMVLVLVIDSVEQKPVDN